MIIDYGGNAGHAARYLTSAFKKSQLHL